MDHLLQLCTQPEHRSLIYIIMGILIFAGIGIGMSLNKLLPFIKSLRKPVVEFNVGKEPVSEVEEVVCKFAPSEAGKPHGPYCEFCAEHPSFMKYVTELKTQQSKNMEAITNIRLVQEGNVTIINSITAQQSKMWEKLESVPNQFILIRGELGEIKGMVKAIHDLKS
jgi:hypothetical protein